MKQRTINKAHERICRRLRTTHEQVAVKPVQGMFNFRCHENCVEYVRRNPDLNLRIWETIYIDEGDPILHYILKDEAAGAFLEVTLGWRAEHLEYYLIRLINPDDYPRIHSEFRRSLDHWLEEYVGWFGRKVLGVDRVL